MMLTLTNKVALVTGASRGIGREIARTFAGAGAQVIVNYRTSAKEAHELVERITQAGGRATALQADVRDEKEVAELFTKLLAKEGRLDILVNNAGILKNNLLLMTSLEEFESIIAANCRGTFLCTRAALKTMVAQRSGKIINLSSIAGVYGNRGQSAYAASKAAIIGFTKSVAKEMGGFGITVNAIAPGVIETEMMALALKKNKTELLSTIALGRFGAPEDVARVALFLASPLADYVSGQIIGVDGCQIL